MNQLCVPIPTASDTQQILKDVFSLCRIPWIYEFIFYADPSADISMLLAPVQKRHALSAKIFVNATETSSRYAHTFDFNKELMFYSIPAFSVGSITAGFCVEQPAIRKPQDKSKDELQCIRFVRDDTNGIFLHVSENEKTGVTEVDCLTHKSSVRRTRVRMKFDLRSLRNVLKTPKGILHPSDIYPSLIYLNVSDEKRSCPVCCDPTAADCGCELPLQRPSHPLDFRFEASNMGLYTGFYQGATVVRLCSAGHCVITATLQSGSVIQGELNRDLITKLHKLAVLDRLSKIKETPVALIMPNDSIDISAMMDADAAAEVVAALSKHASNGPQPATEQLTEQQNGFVQGHEQTDEVDRIAAEAKIELPNKVTLDADALFASDHELNGNFAGDTLMDANGFMGDMDNVCSSDAKMTDENGNVQADVAVMNIVIGPSGCSSSASVSSKRGSSSSSCTDNPKLDSPSCSDKTPVSGHDIEVMKLDLSGAVASGVNDRNEVTNNELHLNGVKGSKREEKEAKAVPEIPLTEEEKALIRRKRNREAAARSNLKRKLRNESVRRDLAKLTQRAIGLRVKEMMLRDENNRLRNALRDAKIIFLPNG